MTSSRFTKPVGDPDGNILPVNLPAEVMNLLQRVHHLVMRIDVQTAEQREALLEIQELLRRYGFWNG